MSRRIIAALLLLAVAVPAPAITLTPHGGGIRLQLCDDVSFTVYRKVEGGIVHGVQIPQGGLVLTCPRTNATWHLLVTGCAAPTIKTLAVGDYELIC